MRDHLHHLGLVGNILHSLAKNILHNFCNSIETTKIRGGRQLCRDILGPDAYFIVMNLTKSCQKKRIEARHGSGDMHTMLTKIFDLYEPAGEDEEGAYNVTITEDMTPQDVLKEVLAVIAKI